MSAHPHASPAGLADVIPMHPAVEPPKARRKYTRLPEDTRARLARRLLALEAERGLTKADYERAAHEVGVAVRTIETLVCQARRNLATLGTPAPEPRRRRSSKVVITEDVLVDCHVGTNVMNGYLAALASGAVEPCAYSTYAQALYGSFGKDVIRGLQRGEPVMPSQWVYLERSISAPGEMFTIDMFFPGVRTIRDGQLVIPVWVCVRDRGTGLILAWHQFARPARGADDERGDPAVGPNSIDIRALIGEAIRGWTRDGVFAGGVPLTLRCDREALFLTPDLRAHLMSLAVCVDPTNSYSSWENGAHERMHRVIRNEALDGLPASTRGPQRRGGKLVFDDTVVEFSELDDRLTRWVESYNFERPTDEFDGRTRFDVWAEHVNAGAHINRAAPATLAPFAKPLAELMTVGKAGVLRPGTTGTFAAAALMAPGFPKTVALSAWLNDDDHLEAFDPQTGAFLATLYRRAAMPVQEEALIITARGASTRSVNSMLDRAKRQERIRNGPAVARPQPAVAVETPTPDNAATVSADSPDVATDVPVGAAARFARASAQQTGAGQ